MNRPDRDDFRDPDSTSATEDYLAALEGYVDWLQGEAAFDTAIGEIGGMGAAPDNVSMFPDGDGEPPDIDSDVGYDPYSGGPEMDDPIDPFDIEIGY